MKMNKKVNKKDDGRNIYFYTFEDIQINEDENDRNDHKNNKKGGK